jgi:hypothetical protein
MKNLILILLILIYSQAKGQVQLLNFTPSQCDQGENPERIKTRIVSQHFEGDIFKVEVGTIATCCVSFIPAVEFKNSVLHLRFRETGNACTCDCCYQFVYHIAGLKGKKFTIKLQDQKIEYSQEKYLTYPVKFNKVGKDTINYVDKYGFKQGLHIIGKLKQPREKLIYQDGAPWQGSQWITYYPNGNKKKEMQYAEGKKHLVEYYENGRKKAYCTDHEIILTDESWRYETLCDRWDSLGNQVQTAVCCLLDSTISGQLRLLAFKYKNEQENEVFVDGKDVIKESQLLERLERLHIKPGTQIILCTQKDTEPQFVEKVKQALLKLGLTNIEHKEFETTE